MRTIVFGADGGGSKTLGLLADQSGTILAERSGGPTNAHVVGVAEAVENLVALIEGCCNAAACALSDVRCFVVGLAGVGRSATRQALREELIRRLYVDDRLTIETDARVALEGAFAGDPGIVIIAGTGSVVMGKDSDGTIAMTGGWGRLLGDEGSGYGLGLAALHVLAKHLDGRAEKSSLTASIVRETTARSRDELLAFVYRNGFEPARLAPLVLEAAQHGDPDALAILERGALELVAQLQSLLRRLRFDGSMPVALIGGLVQQENIYTRILVQRMQAKISRIEVRRPLYPPAMGAVLMAMQHAGFPIPKHSTTTER